MAPLNIVRVTFWSVFSLGANDGLVTTRAIIVNGQRFNAGTSISKKDLLAGVDFNARRGIDLAVTTLVDGTYEIQGFYLNG